MRDGDKPFLMFRRNWFIHNITPRNASGWMQMGVWMALFAAMTVGFAAFDSARPADSTFGAPDAVFLVGLLVWTVGGIWWMKSRAEVIDANEVIRQKREAERKSRRGR
ncbi:hypothetical protein [Erythrobacter tepidarius]|uniref:hypothetical protein n=1 Tax=Erythrobacter tepidarius TaxID=60454 RepID=UPI00117F4E68|nr:hypothetical protein [Erythrobacter tepidarius]